MKTVSFPITRVNRLREAAAAAARAPDDEPALARAADGWFISTYDASALLKVFDALWLRPGFSLHAYRLYQQGDGNGAIWAVSYGASKVHPRDCRYVDGTVISIPRPPQAVPLMRAIDGDSSPWSYLSASILLREAAEFGASWHGCVWSSKTIIGRAPRERESHEPYGDDDWQDRGEAPVGEWTWRASVPRTWEPTFVDRGKSKDVVLYVHDVIGEIRIDRVRDVYLAESYECATKIANVCTGGPGPIY